MIAVHKYLECDEQLRIDSHRSHSHSHAHACPHTHTPTFSVALPLSFWTYDTTSACIIRHRVINFIILVFIIIECNPSLAAPENERIQKKRDKRRENKNLTCTYGYILDTFSTDLHLIIKCNREKSMLFIIERCTFAKYAEYEIKEGCFSYILSAFIKWRRKKLCDSIRWMKSFFNQFQISNAILQLGTR